MKLLAKLIPLMQLVGRCCWKTYISKVFLKPELRLAGVNPFEDGVTRVDRKWVELSEEEKLKTGPFHSESVYSMTFVGFLSVNLVSSLRVINNVDPVFVALSVKDACLFASPHDRLKSTATEGHKCHPLQLSAALKYIKEEGVQIHPENKHDTFTCIVDIPEKDGGIYLGPTSNNYVYEGLHAVVVDAFLVNGELVMWCKSSHGENMHNEGYFMVAASIMVTALHYGVSDRHPTYGINHDNKPLDEPFDITTPQPLIHDFVYPMLDSKNKRKR
ncbi:unnamed protein product [Cochlearia groenlandica]